MASFTVGGQRWADGTTVGAYPAAAWPDTSQAPSGSAVATAAVAGGAVTFTGLATNVRYVAYASGVGVRFVVPQVDPSDTRALRARVDELAGATVPANTASIAATQTSVARINAGLEFNVRDSDLFPGLFPNGISSTDSTAGINAAIAYASAQATARGQRKARLYGFNGANYMVGEIVAKSNVDLQCDGAKFTARADIPFLSILRNLGDAIANLNAAVAVGTATTTSGSYELTALSGSSIASYYDEMKVTGTNIPASTKVVAVDKLNNKVILDAAATGSTAGVTITRAATHYGGCDDFSVHNLEIDPNGFEVGDAVRMLYTRNLVLDGVTVLHNMKVGAESWAFNLGGRNGKVTACNVLGGGELFEDGIHISHGQRWNVENYYVESGDDAIACGPAASDASLLRDPDPLRYVTIGVGEVRSMRGAGFAAFCQAGALGRDWEVTDINVTGMTGRSGILRNGGFKITDSNAGAAGTSQVKRIGIHNVRLAIGSTSHDETGAYGLFAQSVAGLTLNDVTIAITQKAAPATPYDVYRVFTSDDVVLRDLLESVSAGPYNLTSFSQNGSLDVY